VLRSETIRAELAMRNIDVSIPPWERPENIVPVRSHPLRAVTGGRCRARTRVKPVLVQLEDRRLLATFTVTSPLDTVTSGVAATGTLRWAIEQAQLAGGTDLIDFSSSVFNTQQTVTLGSGNGTLTLSASSSSITIDGPGPGLLTINGNNNAVVLQVNSGVTAAVSGMTITGGGSTGVNDLGSLTLGDCALTDNPGGGLYVKGTADVTDCTITGNNRFSGGGVLVATGGTATITGSTISDNISAGGGGLANDGTATVSYCVIDGNSSLGSGAGLYNSGKLTVKDCTVSGNSGTGFTNNAGTAYLSGTTISDSAGGINGGNILNAYGATITLVGCIVSGGTANSGAGVYNGGTATITDCTISDNSCSGGGGGITDGRVQPKAVMFLKDSTVIDNTAVARGGGLDEDGTATLTDDTFADNLASNGSQGGGINNGGNATLVACTITGNTTTSSGGGGGVYNGAPNGDEMTLDDTIVAGNISTASGSAVADDIALPGNFAVDVTGKYNLIGPGGSGGLVGGSDGNIVLTSVSGLGLMPLGDYGGPTETVALEPGSVAIGAGRSSIPGVTIPTTDQRGFPLDTPTPDIGAYQIYAGALVVGVASDTGAGAPSGETDLRGAVNLANLRVTASTITFDPTVFATNQTITLIQGPIELSDTTAPTAIVGPSAGVTISGGGASRVFQVDPGVTALMSALTITQGGAGNGAGLNNQGSVQLADCTVSGNSATGVGGGVDNQGVITLTNCTFSGNDASGGGAGIANSGTAELFACTLTGNTATVGGGIDNLGTGTATLEDTLIAANASAAGPASDIGGSDPDGVTGAFDLVGIGGAGGISGTGDIVLSTLAGLGLAPLANYGGPCATIALLPGNPAIGAGTAISGIIADARGDFLDSPNPDIGAFQSQGFVLTLAVGSSPQETDTGTAFADPLALTVTANNSEEPVAGGVVTFAANPPSNGASADLSALTATISSTGTVQITATANSVAGSYTVVASTGEADTAAFALSNLYQASFSGVSDQTISYGSGSVTVAGTLADGSEVPSTGNVAVTLAGDTQQASIGSDGGFSATFMNTSGLTVSGSPYAIDLTYGGNDIFAPISATFALTVAPAVPTVTAVDAGGIYNDSSYAATVGVAGVGGASSSSLEGVKVSRSYYSGTYTSANQLTGVIPLVAAPIGAGNYTVLASFPGSADYTSNAAVINFTIAQASPTVSVADAGGTYSGAAYPATATVAGIHGSSGTSLEGASVAIAYYNGTYAAAGQLVGLTPLPAAPTDAGAYTVLASFPGSADFTSGLALANFSIEPATPEVSVVDSGGPYSGTAFTATTTVAGIDGSPGPSLEGVSPSLSYYRGTFSNAGQLAGVEPLSITPSQVGSYTTLASFAGSTDYASGTALANFTITQGTPVLTWGGLSSIVYGTSLGAAQLDARTSVPGSYSYSPAAGAVLNAGSNQMLLVRFTPQDAVDYATVTANATITVERATPTFELSDSGGLYNSSPFPASDKIIGVGEDNSPAPSLEGVTPTLAYYFGSGTSGTPLGSTAPSAVGSYTVVASFAGTADYLAVESAPVSFTIGGLNSTIALSTSTGSAVFGQPITLVATVAAAEAPSGTVAFFDDGRALGTVAVDGSGKAVLTTSALATGAQTLTADFSGNAVLKGAQSGSAPESIAQSGTSLVLVADPVKKKKKLKSEGLTAEINPISPGGGVPGGVVTFELLTKKKKKIKTKVLGSAIAGDGAATMAFKPKKVLGKVITIIYSGDTDFTASTFTAHKLSKKGHL
jgi:Bacterial Ig-like domain (group 3)